MLGGDTTVFLGVGSGADGWVKGAPVMFRDGEIFVNG